MTEAIDFTQCERLPGRAYNGANGKRLNDKAMSAHETHS